MNNTERKTLYLGAFLHDIGKAIQRTGSEMTKEQYYGKHPEQGYNFLLNKKELLKNVFSEEQFACLLTYVRSHHESYYFKDEERADKIENLKLKCLATMVSKADNFSFYNFGRLNLENIFYKNTNSEKALGGLIDDFSENFDNLLKIKNVNNIEYGLNYLIYNYFWCIPANTKEENPDISLTHWSNYIIKIFKNIFKLLFSK